VAAGLGALRELPDVDDALSQARTSVDAALSEQLRRRAFGSEETSLRSAVASAALEGHRYDVEEVRAGTVTDPVVQGALRVSEALPGLVDVWRSAPRQALARLHVLAARGSVSSELLGRPSGSASSRIDQLVEVILTPGDPALLRAAVVHGELLSLRPFDGPNGLVARAAARLTLIADGLDPDGLLAPEVAHLEREPEYLGCANAFATGTSDGVRAWIRHCCTAVSLAARALRSA
jgi:Fic family protein